MLKKKSILSLLLLLFSLSVFAQQTARYTSDYAVFEHGIKLFHQHQYTPAQHIFERLHKRTEHHNLKAKTAYYAAIAAVHLQQFDAEDRLRHFLETYPESPKRNSAYSNVAGFYFQNGQYGKALQWYEKVNENGLSGKERNEYYFNKGYAAFKTGKKEKAKYYFNQVKNNEEYGSQAKYYLGFMAYESDHYEKANTLFEGVDEKDQAQKKVSYFQSNMSFKSGNFEKAIQQAKEQLPRATRRAQSELNKIIGESYFNLKEYEKAIPYLEKYQGKRGRWSNTDYYQLGFAYYKMGNYKKAVSQFNQIIDGHDAVAQNAYYHLAECYIELGQKQRALNAFKNASEMDFNAQIKEDAALNYAKLSYDIGNNYKSVPEVLTEFLKAYPNSPAKGEIQSLLVNSYLTSKNYKKAMDLLEKSRDFVDKKVYQKVAFYRGMELYSAEKYKRAQKLFDKSLSQRKVPVYTARATYWKAECDYILGDYQRALIGYKQFMGMDAARKTPEFKAVDYNIGYAYFNQKKYKSAKAHFQDYASRHNIDPRQKNDAFLRLGDCYFALSDYWQAMEAYNKAIAQKNVDSDYAYYQKAISYGFVGKNNRKIEDLEAFINRFPKSIYRDDALYQLGNTYVAENQPTKALKAYNDIVTQMPNSRYASKAMIKRGLVYYNSGKNEKALSIFKKVAANYPKSEEAYQAIRSTRNIYVDLGRIDEYAAWVKELGYVNLSNEDIDNATYEAAENQMLDNKDQAAARAYAKYLKKFPNGLHALTAHYHLAQILYRQNDKEGAQPHYEYIVAQSRNDFTEKSLKRLSRIYLEKRNYQKAISVMTRLEDMASLQANITFAQSNLMKAYYEQKDYAKTVVYAEKVLANDKAGNQAKSDAHIFIARSAMKTGDEQKAEKAYRQVAKMAHGKLAAEAQYYDAYFKRKAGHYKASNKSVQVLANDYSGYKEFSVKGLLLMAKNFDNLGDAYQATYILESIIENFKEYPEVVAEAKRNLQRIKAEEAKTNSSVKTTPTGDTTKKSLDQIKLN